VAARRVVLRQLPVLDRRRHARHLPYRHGQLADGELARVAQVDRSGLIGVEHGQEAAHEVVHVTEAVGLLAVTVDGGRAAAQRLGDEVVLRMRTMPVFRPSTPRWRW
jgi:hypothetical protein